MAAKSNPYFYEKDVVVNPAWEHRQPIPGGRRLKNVVHIYWDQGSYILDTQAELEHKTRFKSQYKAFLESKKPKAFVKPVAAIVAPKPVLPVK